MKFLRSILLLILSLASADAVAQIHATRDCNTATTLCSNETIYDTILNPVAPEQIYGYVLDVPSGQGASCFGNKGERRPFWYQFTVENSGTFEMFIEDDIMGDWDFVLYDKSNGCGKDNWVEIACNASDDIFNQTGISTERYESWESSFSLVNPWHPTVELTEGNTYVIFINGVDTRPGDGFRLSFGGTVNFKDIEVSFSPDANPSCPGREITFTNTSTYPSGEMSYLWDFGDGNTDTSEHATHTYDEPGSYWVKLTIDNGSCIDEDSVQVDIDIPDMADAGPDQSICYGINTELSGAGGVSYSWTPSESLSDANIANPVASPTQTTDYVLTVTDDIGCVDTDTVTVEVTYIDVDAGDDHEVCPGDTVQFSASGGVEYQWLPDNGSLSQNDIYNPSASPVETTTYQVTITDEDGCINYDSLTVSVFDPPVADAGEDEAICYGLTTQLNASGGIAYEWSPAEGLSDTDIANPVASPNQTTTYVVSVTGENGCVSQDSVTVTVNYIEVDAGEDQDICYGTTAELEASGGVEYSWSPSSTLSTNNVADPTASPEETTTYTVTVTDEDGCINYDSVTIQVSYIEVSAGEDVIICQGDTAQLEAQGGSQYSWSPTAGLNNAEIYNPEASPLETTEYIVTVTDDEGCVNYDTVLVQVNPVPNIDAGEDETICNGLTTQLNASGTASSWSWSPSEGLSATDVQNPEASPSVTTTYTVIATNEFECSSHDEVTVNVTYIEVDAGEDQEICYGTSTQLTATGGVDYLWSPSTHLSDENIANPEASPEETTEYIVNVTDENGCINSDTVTVDVYFIDITTGDDQTICEGDTVELEATGGTNFSWTPSESLLNENTATPSAFPEETTAYIVTVEDAEGCINYDTVTVVVNPKPTIDAGEDQEICYGNSAQLTATGGIDYQWSPSATLSEDNIADPIASPEQSTVYTVLGVDENGCENKDSVEVQVTLIEVSTSDDQEICLGDSVQLTASGGSQYSWTPTETLNNAEIEDPIATPQETTTYYVTITDTEGCVNYDSVTVVVNPIPVLDAGENQSICFGTSAQLNANGGGNNYLWTPATGLSDAEVSNPTATPSETTTYTVITTDNNGCSNSDEVTVEVTYIEVSAGEDQTICHGTSAQLEATGGDNYSWSSNPTLSDENIANPIATPSDTTTYFVTVTDANGCQNTDSVTVNVDYIEVDAGEDQVICFGDSAQLEASGGETYSWTPAGSLNNAEIADPVANPTETTQYIVTITDAEGCVNTDSITVQVNPVPVADAGDDQVSCQGVPVQLNATGGDTYSWSPAESLSDASVADPEATPQETTTYTVIVTDENGCSSSDEVTVTIEQIEVNAGEDQTICFGDSVQFEATGGTSYTWNHEETLSDANVSNPYASPETTTKYVVTITDKDGCMNTDTLTVTVNQLPMVDAGDDQEVCNGLSAQLSGAGDGDLLWAPEETLSATDIENPVATTSQTTVYTLTVTDANGCQNTDSVTVNVDYIEVDAGEDQVICFGDSAQLEASGGETYSWTPAGSLNNAEIANPVADPTETTQYIVTITDAEGCVNMDSITVQVNPVPVADAGDDQVSCQGVPVQLNATGGDTYSWSPAESLSDASVADPEATPQETTTYTVTVTDENGCSSSDEVTVTIEQIEVNAGEDQTICFGDSVQFEATGGTTYTWNNQETLSDANVSNPYASPETTTDYVATITDEDGCMNTDTLTVTVNQLPMVDAGDDQEVCNGLSAQLSGSGDGDLLWAPEETLSATDIENPVATTSQTTVYTLTVTDANGCQNTDSVTVSVNFIEVDAGEDQVICNGVSAQLNASGGVSYNWTPSETLSDPTTANPVATPQQTTEYAVEVTDADGCINSDTIIVSVTYIEVSAGEDQDVCFGNTVQLEASGGASYLWSPEDELSDNSISNPTAAPSDTTDFIVTVTDAEGCVNTDTVRVNVTFIEVSAGPDQYICEGAGDSVQLSASGGVSFTWFPDELVNINNIQEPVASISETTDFSVIVTDENGCINTDTMTVYITDPPIADAGEDQTICNGLSAELQASGGETYLWSPEESLSEYDIENPEASPNTTTTYTVSVTDSLGCTNTDEVTIYVTYIEVDAGADQDICFGDSTELTASGGTSYTWTPGDYEGETIKVTPTDTTVYTVTVIDQDGCKNIDSVQVNIKPLPEGSITNNPESLCLGDEITVSASFNEGFTPHESMAYSFDGGQTFQNTNELFISDVYSDTIINILLLASNECYSDTIEHEINLKSIDATASQHEQVSCFGEESGAAIVEVSGSETGTYQFSINGTEFQPDNIFTNLAAGDYDITIINDADCRFLLPVTITEPEALLLEVLSVTHVGPCAGDDNGEIVLEASGGTPAYMYTINNSEEPQEESTFTEVPAYEHTVAVIDQNGCVAEQTVLIEEPDAVKIDGITADIKDNVCHGKKEGEITLDTSSVTGAKPPYTYTFDGETKEVPEFTEIFGGDFNIVITDSDGCEFRHPFTIGQPEPITFFTRTSKESCQNRDGEITINNPQGGTPPYTYSVNGSSFGNNPEFTGLAAGTYHNITVMDSKGCSAGQPDTVRRKEGPDVHITKNDVTCFDLEDGSVVIDSVSGGLPFMDAQTEKPYFEYSLDSINWIRDSLFTGLAADTFQLFIKDQECVYLDKHPFYSFNNATQEWDTLKRDYFVLGQPNQLEAAVFSTPSVRNQSNGTVGIIDISGGIEPYYFSGDNQEFSPVTSDTAIVSGFDRGMQTVFLKDSNECTISLSVFVDKPILIPNLITPNNDGLNDYFEIVSIPRNTTVTIYNRWGSEVYHDENYNNSWDGDGVPDGVYYYDITFPDKRLVKGWVEVKR
ncbi:gliding motility-associated C-terminal domain-containing protein [Cytophagaceae bacterium ABcell3]|nr:gliding motility-associated C-terminal domain-containing protein [Cytophagaceae bacterium ABcell3]